MSLFSRETKKENVDVSRSTLFSLLFFEFLACDNMYMYSAVLPSQEPRPTCWWKWVGRTKGVKSGISTLTVNISAKFQCFDQSGAFFGTAHAWIFRIRWENEKKFTNIVAGAPRVSSPSFARFFPQFRQDLFGFVTYGFLTVHLSDLFHLSIRSVLQLRNVVLMCISSLIKPQINLICGLFNHTVALCWILFLSIFLQFQCQWRPTSLISTHFYLHVYQTRSKLVQKPRWSKVTYSCGARSSTNWGNVS